MIASSRLDRVEGAIQTALAWAVSATLASIAGICFVEVVLRYGFGSSFGWYDEFVGYLLVWLTFLGAVLAQSQGRHIGIENLLERAPGKLRLALRFANHAVIVGIHLVLLFYGSQIVARLITERAITLPIPMGFVYAVLPVSALFMLVVESIHIARTVRAG